MYAVTLQGFCIGGTQQQGVEGVGYVVFMRLGSPNAIKLIAAHLVSLNVLMPFIAWVRRTFFGWVPGTPVPARLRAAVWLDGEMSQLAVMMEENVRPS